MEQNQRRKQSQEDDDFDQSVNVMNSLNMPYSILQNQFNISITYNFLILLKHWAKPKNDSGSI